MSSGVDARAFIAGLPADMRETGTVGTASAVVGLASISEEIVAQLYGQDNQYRASRWLDVEDVGGTDPKSNTEYTDAAGKVYLVLRVHKYPGRLRRLDLGPRNA